MGHGVTTPRQTRARTAAVSVLTAVVVVLGGVWQPALAAVDAGAEGDFVRRVNSERTRRGLAPLTVRDDLRAVARRHARRMADRGRLEHNPGVGSEVCCWQRIAENIGRGGTVADIHRAFMASSSHNRYILARHFDEVGVGVERRGGTLWVTQVFRQRQRAAARAEQPRSPAPPAAESPPQSADAAESPRPAPPRKPAPAPTRAPRPARTAPPTAAATAPQPTAPAVVRLASAPPRPAPPPCPDRLSVNLARLQGRVSGARAGDVLAALCAGR